MVARDGGTPPRTDTTVVNVKVTRNLNKPSFDPPNYEQTIKETLELGETIATVVARDADRRVRFLRNCGFLTI